MIDNISLAGLIIALMLATVTHQNLELNNYQYYPTVQYFLNSNLSMAIISLSLAYTMLLFCLCLKKLCFGDLRLIEYEHIQEYGWLSISESFLAMTIFRDELDARFIIIFSFVILVKSLHWITRDRVDFMEQTNSLTPFFHQRIIFILILLSIVDSLSLISCIYCVVRLGPSMAILFANEFALLFINLCSITTHYLLNVNDLRLTDPWEDRSLFLFYFDFAIDTFKLIAYSLFFVTVVIYYGVPIHIIRDLYVTIRSFVIRIRDIIRYRKATNNMNNRYPDATQEEINATDRLCIICRDEMTSAKKLRCGHFFHFRCLRSWLERQQACPTCRQSILVDENQMPTQTQEEHHQNYNIRNVQNQQLNLNIRRQDRGDPAVVPRRIPQQIRSLGNLNAVEDEEYPANIPRVPIIMIPPDQIEIGDVDNLRNSSSGDEVQDTRHEKTFLLRSSGNIHSPIHLNLLQPKSSFSREHPHSSSMPLPSNILSIKHRINHELGTLSRLQVELSKVTERLIQIEDQLDNISTEDQDKNTSNHSSSDT